MESTSLQMVVQRILRFAYLPYLFSLTVTLGAHLQLVDRAFSAEATDSQEKVIETLELLKEEENISIASRYEQPISQAPSNVYVITDEDIRQSGATDIPTVLRRVPGIEVMQMSGADINVSARGDNQMQANKMLVMVDGRSIYLEGQGIVLWKLLPVTLPEIKRIEVMKGPSSALYGFNAFDGVINIITKSPDEIRGTTLQFGGGTYGTISSAAIHAGRQGSLGYRLSFGADQNNSWQNRDSLAFRSYKFNLLTEYDLSALSKVSMSGGLVDANRFDGPIVSTAIIAARPAQWYANIAYERPDFFVRAWYTGFNNDGQINTNPLIGNLQQTTDINGNSFLQERNDVYNLDAQHTLNLGNQFRVNYGANYRHITVQTNFAPSTVQQDRLGLFVQGEWKATSKLTAVAGVRYDLHTEITPTVSPRVALIYMPYPEHSFRASVSVGYRPPTPIETNDLILTTINLPPPIPSPPPFLFQGSKDLKPEQIVSYEIGYQGWFLKHRLRVRGDLFFNHVTNLVGANGATLSFANGGTADIYGGEAGVEFLVTRWLSGFANFSYVEIGQNLTGEIRRGAPRYKANGGLRGEWENGINGEAALYWVGAATYPVPASFTDFAPFGVMAPNPRVGSYNLLNLRVGYKFWKQKASAGYLRDAEVALTAFNALNDKHIENPLGQTIGSRVMGWLTVRF